MLVLSVGKLFNLGEEDVYNLSKANKKISEELLAFIVKEKPYLGKISGDEDLTNYIQKMSQERYDYRMHILEDSYNKIPENRLDKPLNPFLQAYKADTIQYAIARLSPLLKKVKKASEIKNIFSSVAKTSRTGDIIRIQEAISFNLIKALDEIFTPFLPTPEIPIPLMFYTSGLTVLPCRTLRRSET